MKDTIKQLKEELEVVVKEGKDILKEWASKGEFDDILTLTSRYQNWYTKSLAIIRQLLPERLPEFRSLYKLDKRKELNSETYTISDYLATWKHPWRAPDPHSYFLSNLNVQVSILTSAYSRIDYLLSDAKGALRADLFDSELEKASELARNNYLRAAGLMAGVVLESHMAAVCSNHQISLTKSRPTLADYNEQLKKAGVYDTADWQKIQWLASMRNVCAHAGQREPTKEEIESLIAGVNQVIKLIH